MINKLGILLMVALFVFCIYIQPAEGGVQGYSAFNISVTVIGDLSLKLEDRNPIEFEPSSAVKYENDEGLFIKKHKAGSTLICTNIPWKLFAEGVECVDAEIYIRISDKNNTGWIPVNDEPLIVSGARGEFELTWDIKVVKESIDEEQSIALDFNLAPGDGYEKYFSETREKN